MNAQERNDFLAKLIKIDTIGGHEDRIAVVLKDLFDKHGIKNELVPVSEGRSDFYAEIGEGKSNKVLGFSGHEDVVKTGDPKEWKFPPLSAHIEDGKMFGRGTADMKSGLAAIALAMVELADEKALLNGKLKLLATVGEETSQNNHMQGARKFAQDGYVDDLNAVIIAEPSNGDIVYAHKGSITYQVTSEGIAAHSSTPEKGYNAITPLIRFYEEQEKYFNSLTDKNKDLGKTVPVVTKFSGGDQLNSVPDHAELFVKMRTIPEITNDEIIQHVESIINNINDQYNAKLAINILGNKIPVVTNRHSETVSLIEQINQQGLGKDFSIHGISAGTDASEMTKANSQMDVVIWGPGSNTPHQYNEYVVLDQYNRFIDMYKKLAKQYLNKE